MSDKYDWSRGILDIAADFYEAYKRCRKEKPIIDDQSGNVRGNVVNVPALVNGAFALELYLKSLIPENQIEPKKLGHSFTKIYLALEPDLQRQIRDNVELKLKNWEQTFDEALGFISNAFEYWRYIHEAIDPKLAYELNTSLIVLPLFLDAVRVVIKNNQKTD